MRWLILLFSFSQAQSSPIQQLDHFLTGLNSLKARFIQLNTDLSTGKKQYSRGQFYLQKPDRIRWQYEGPEGSLLIADGQTVWLIEPDLNQVSQQNQKKALRGSLIALLLEDSEHSLHDFFQQQILPNRSGFARLLLIPKKESEWKQLELHFKSDQLQEVEMIDQFDQKIQIHFYDLERNPILKVDLFRFQPPPGYDILEQDE